MRTRDYRRHHRERVIRNRLFVIRNAWYHSPRLPVRPPWWVRKPGLLDTTHLCACSCDMCKGERYERHKVKAEERRLLLAEKYAVAGPTREAEIENALAVINGWSQQAAQMAKELADVRDILRRLLT